MADIPWYTLREQIQIPKIFEKCGLDLAHFPHFNVPLSYKGKFIVTIHDLILFRYPTKKASTLSPFVYFLKKQVYYKVIRHAIEKSEKIIAVSEHTKKDILRHFAVLPQKIAITYEAVDAFEPPLHVASQTILEKYGIMKPFVLYVGNAYPHKNLERLVLAFKEVAKKHPGLNLVLAGKEDYFYKRLRKFVDSRKISDIIFTSHISEEHLSTIYREAKLYVFPSLYEGFGLPPLEAMARNIPVASSNATCLPEILGEAAYYFDSRGISETAEAIEKVLTDNPLRKKLISAGQAQVKKYSWEKMAKETLEIYKDA